MRGPNKSVQVFGTLEGKGKRKTCPSFQSPCKSLRRSNAFLEEKDADVSEPVGLRILQFLVVTCVMVSG